MKAKISLFSLSFLLLALMGPLPVRGEEMSPAGKHLAEILDSMHVEKLWLAGHKVNWRTGQSVGVYEKKDSHTHCSAFAAAAAEKLGVYLLHPPEHSAVLLANAQQDWLRTTGTNQGWRPVATPQQAQHLANQGQLVVVTCKNHDPKLPGHIAIVRPCVKSEALIVEEGPQIIQAGHDNFISTSVREGFKHHPGAFAHNELLYFVHPLPVAFVGAE